MSSWKGREEHLSIFLPFALLDLGPPLSPPPPPKKHKKELLRENKRQLDRAIRDLDRERMGLQSQEKKLVAEIKRAAKDGQMEAVRVMAQSLVRNRHSVAKLHGLKAQLQAVSLRLATLKSTQAMADAMAGATRAMVAMNRRMNMPALTKVRGRRVFFFFFPLPGAFSVLFFSVAPSPLFLLRSLTFRTLSSANRSCATSSARTSAWRPPRR